MTTINNNKPITVGSFILCAIALFGSIFIGMYLSEKETEQNNKMANEFCKTIAKTEGFKYFDVKYFYLSRNKAECLLSNNKDQVAQKKIKIRHSEYSEKFKLDLPNYKEI